MNILTLDNTTKKEDPYTNYIFVQSMILVLFTHNIRNFYIVL